MVLTVVLRSVRGGVDGLLRSVRGGVDDRSGVVLTVVLRSVRGGVGCCITVSQGWC